ncbi:MAG TPA: Ig-like domain-containing protein [Labilithrix sp.]|nr:Ig-like domain-containing protein [Labilithrix sp.]
MLGVPRSTDALGSGAGTRAVTSEPAPLTTSSQGDERSPAPSVATFGGGTLGGTPSANVAGSTAVVVPQGSVTLDPSGALTFVPAAGFFGLFTFSYVLAQGTQQITVTKLGAFDSGQNGLAQPVSASSTTARQKRS